MRHTLRRLLSGWRTIRRRVDREDWSGRLTHEPYELNVVGDFYVTAGCCTLCGVPWSLAPSLFDYSKTHCWVARQPNTSADLEQMLAVMESQELRCIRYAGSDPRIIARLRAAGEGGQCDAAS